MSRKINPEAVTELRNAGVFLASMLGIIIVVLCVFLIIPWGIGKAWDLLWGGLNNLISWLEGIGTLVVMYLLLRAGQIIYLIFDWIYPVSENSTDLKNKKRGIENDRI